MRITAIAAHTLRWPIAATGAARGRSERTAIVVEVRSDRGTIGLGEAAPLPGLSRDTLDDANAAVTAFAGLAPFDLAARAGTPPSGAAIGSQTEDATRVAGLSDAGFLFAVADRELMQAVASAPPAARFAIETALCDALAREAGRTLASWLVAQTDPSFAGAVVDDGDAARQAYAAGIRCLKIKLAADDPSSRVPAIAAAAPGARLRIDANRSWPPAEVAARLAALAALPIDYVEEPCRDAHRLLATPLPCRIALDESLGDLGADELAAALASPQLAAVILKPTLLGGLSACLALAVRARRAGVAAIVSHGLEGPIGTAACAELALALGHRGGAAAGLAPHAALAGWSIQVAQLAADHVRPAGAPGLGFAGLDLTRAVAACPASGRAVAVTARQG
jgi:o-succinylbenzoate synthase